MGSILPIVVAARLTCDVLLLPLFNRWRETVHKSTPRQSGRNLRVAVHTDATRLHLLIRLEEPNYVGASRN